MAGVAVLLFLLAAVIYHVGQRPQAQPTKQPTSSQSSPQTPSNSGTQQQNDKKQTTTPPVTNKQAPASQPQSPAAKGGTGGGGSTSGGGGTGGSGGGSSGGGGGTSGGCTLPAYPDASCTGVPANTSLAVINGDMTINTAGTIIDGKDIRGCVVVAAPSVVIRNSKIACSNSVVIGSFAGTYSGVGLLLQDVEISCNNTGGTGVGDTNITVRRVNIHSCENGFDLDGDVTIEDSFIHDLYNTPSTHTDGAQITDVGHNITIKHNTIYDNNGTSAIISPDVANGVVSNILIQDNLLAGGSYTLYCQQSGPGINYRVINNHFSTIFYPDVGNSKPWTDCQDEAQVTGNVYHESGQPVPFS